MCFYGIIYLKFGAGEKKNFFDFDLKMSGLPVYSTSFILLLL